MAVRAKFKVISIAKREHWNKNPDGSIRTIDDIKLAPVTSGSEENKRFFNASPSGEITLGCLNPEASAQFEIGKEYYVDFTLAD